MKLVTSAGIYYLLVDLAGDEAEVTILHRPAYWEVDWGLEA
jgi:hypothetical protein